MRAVRCRCGPALAYAGYAWIVSLVLALALACPLAAARPDVQALPVAQHSGSADRGGHDNKAQKRAPSLAPGEAARRAARKYGGRVLSVIPEQGPAGPYYRVKLLDSGRVRVVHISARKQ